MGAAVGAPAGVAAVPRDTAAASCGPQGAAAPPPLAQQQPPQPALPAAANVPLSAAALESRRDVKIYIWTAGLRFAFQAPLAARDRSQLVEEAVRSVHCHRAVPAAWPAAFLLSGGWSSSATEITIAVDARVFADRSQGDARRHLGFHGAALHGLVHSRRQEFDVFFADHVWAPILDALAASPLKAPVTVHVFCFCISGRRRSVGIASLLWDVARQATHWNIQIEHLAASSWWVGTCNNCRGCQDTRDSRKEEAFNAAALAADDARRAFDARQLGTRRGHGGGAPARLSRAGGSGPLPAARRCRVGGGAPAWASEASRPAAAGAARQFAAALRF